MARVTEITIETLPSGKFLVHERTLVGYDRTGAPVFAHQTVRVITTPRGHYGYDA